MSDQNRIIGQKLKEKFSATKILCKHYDLTNFTNISLVMKFVGDIFISVCKMQRKAHKEGNMA